MTKNKTYRIPSDYEVGNLLNAKSIADISLKRFLGNFRSRNFEGEINIIHSKGFKNFKKIYSKTKKIDYESVEKLDLLSQIIHGLWENKIYHGQIKLNSRTNHISTDILYEFEDKYFIKSIKLKCVLKEDDECGKDESVNYYIFDNLTLLNSLLPKMKKDCLIALKVGSNIRYFSKTDGKITEFREGNYLESFTKQSSLCKSKLLVDSIQMPYRESKRNRIKLQLTLNKREGDK